MSRRTAREIAANKGDSRRLWQTFKNVLGERPTADYDAHTGDDFAQCSLFPGQSRDRPSIISCDAAVRRATQVHADHHRLEYRDKRRSREADRLTAKQDMSVGPSTHVAWERDAQTPVTLYLLAV